MGRLILQSALGYCLSSIAAVAVVSCFCLLANELALFSLMTRRSISCLTLLTLVGASYFSNTKRLSGWELLLCALTATSIAFATSTYWAIIACTLFAVTFSGLGTRSFGALPGSSRVLPLIGTALFLWISVEGVFFLSYEFHSVYQAAFQKVYSSPLAVELKTEITPSPSAVGEGNLRMTFLLGAAGLVLSIMRFVTLRRFNSGDHTEKQPLFSWLAVRCLYIALATICAILFSRALSIGAANRELQPAWHFLLVNLSTFAGLVPLILALNALPWQAITVTPSQPLTRGAKSEFAIAGIFLATSFVAGLCLFGMPGEKTDKSKILVHNRGGLSWGLRTFESNRSGMFGKLPIVLRNNGFDIDIIDKDEIESKDLNQAKLLVLINSPKVWSEREASSVHQFLENGGNLLVLGDHTDVFGLMKGFNSLLPEYGIEFEFDSAYPAREGWQGCLKCNPSGIFSRFDSQHPGVAIGASLTLSKNARPLILGKYSHSDVGLRENVMGSFLGNYHYDRTEPLGECVLVATANVGQGRIVVYGDTSTFQGSLSHNFEKTVAPLFNELLRSSSWTDQPGTRQTLATTMILSATAALILVTTWKFSLVAAVLGLLAGSSFAGYVSSASNHREETIDQNTVLFVEDQIHSTGHYDLRYNSIGTFYTLLERAGLRLVSIDHWNHSKLMKSRAVLMVAPRRNLTTSQTEQLLDYEKQGGVVILCSGFLDSQPVQRYLASHGLRIANRPMGSIRLKDDNDDHDRTRPRFIDAWPIDIDASAEEKTTCLFSYGNDCCATFSAVGSGGLILISDSRFFSNNNMEVSQGDEWQGNIDFVRNLFQEFLKVDPSQVKPLFRSPEMPN